jgi:hypothetical protein
MPETEVATALVTAGGQVLTPALDQSRFGYRIVLRGLARFAYTGEEFDAVHRTGDPEPHDYLAWTPAPPVLVAQDRFLHHYIFEVPREWSLKGQSVGVGINVDRLVERYLIPPSEVRSQLSSEIRMVVRQAPLVPPNPLMDVARVSVPAALALTAVGLVIRRRMAFRGMTPALAEQALRIDRKYRAACAAVSAEQARQFPLQARLAALKASSDDLVRRTRSIQSARRASTQEALAAEIAALERRTVTLADAAARRDGELALAEKRGALSLLDELAEAETRCLMRLARIEAALDATCVSLRRSQAGEAAERPEDAVCRELDAEVAAIREAARDFPPDAAVLTMLRTPRDVDSL